VAVSSCDGRRSADCRVVSQLGMDFQAGGLAK
jgi:hypothetical protein